MISGIFQRNSDQKVDPDWLYRVALPPDGDINKCRIICEGPIGFSSYPQLNTESKMALKPVFSSTHNLAVVNHIADKVSVMYLGTFVEVGEVNTLF